MPICEGCSGSYADEFSFCPYCGRIKSEPETLEISIKQHPGKYEEASLQLFLENKSTLTQPPFDRKLDLFDMFGKISPNWNEVGNFTLRLNSYHPDKNEYIAFESSAFQAFIVDERAINEGSFALKAIRFPVPVKNLLVREEKASTWLKDFYKNREVAWKEFNKFLIREGWLGLSQAAVKREPPFWLKHTYSLPTKWQDAETSVSDLEAPGALSLGFYDEIADRYTYRRAI